MSRLTCRTAVVSVALALGAAVAAAAQEPVRLGSSIPLTGGAAFFGQHAKWGTELAIADTNAGGGVLGRKLEVTFLDNRCHPAEAVRSVGQMLSTKKYVAVLDGLCSSVVLAIMPLIERARLPLVVATATAPAIAEKSGTGGNRWTFTVNPTEASLAEALVAWLYKEGKAEKLAFLGENTDFGRGALRGFEAALGRRRLKLVSSDFFPSGTANFTPVFAKLRAQRPNAIALYAVSGDFQSLIRQFHSGRVGIPLTGHVPTDKIPREILAGGALEGTTSVQPYALEVDTPFNRAFITAFRRMHNTMPTLHSYLSYEATRVLIDAINRAGKAEPSAIRDALEKTRLSSLLGDDIEFDGNNLAHKNAVILTIRAGQVLVLALSKT